MLEKNGVGWLVNALLPCDAMRCTVSVIVILSVRLTVGEEIMIVGRTMWTQSKSVTDGRTVRPSVTLLDCVHMVRPTIMISPPYVSPIILVSGVSRSSKNSKGVTPSEGVE